MAAHLATSIEGVMETGRAVLAGPRFGHKGDTPQVFTRQFAPARHLAGVGPSSFQDNTVL